MGLGPGESLVLHPPKPWALFLELFLQEASDPALESPLPQVLEILGCAQVPIPAFASHRVVRHPDTTKGPFLLAAPGFAVPGVSLPAISELGRRSVPWLEWGIPFTLAPRGIPETLGTQRS